MKDAGWSIYPNPEKWIWMNCKSISDFAGRIGVAHKTVITLMKGERGTTKYVIDLILKETGMTYANLFEGSTYQKKLYTGSHRTEGRFA